MSEGGGQMMKVGDACDHRDPFDLTRFLSAQEGIYNRALASNTRGQIFISDNNVDGKDLTPGNPRNGGTDVLFWR